MQKYRIIFLDGWWMDFVPPLIPEGFHFPTFITTCRSVGMFLSDQVYIRFDMVRCILPWEGENPPIHVPTAPNAPSTVTKQ